MKNSEKNNILPGFIGKKNDYENCGEILTEEQKNLFKSIKITLYDKEFKSKEE